MSKITYVDDPSRHEIRVFVDGRRTGTIVAVRPTTIRRAGFQYRVKGSTHLHSGEVFSTVAEVKTSLEST